MKSWLKKGPSKAEQEAKRKRECEESLKRQQERDDAEKLHQEKKAVFKVIIAWVSILDRFGGEV